MANGDSTPVSDDLSSSGQLPLPVDPAALQTALTKMPQPAGAMPQPNAPQQNVPPAMPPPNVGSDPGQQQAQQPAPNLGSAQGGQGQQQQGPPKQSNVPALAGFLQQMIKGPGYEQAASGQPGRPISRLDAFENFIGGFLNSFSSGMSNAGTGPAANARGFGSAVQAPYQRQLQQFQLGQQQQQVQSEEQLRQSQAQEAQGRQKFYEAQAEATRRGSEYTPVQIPDGQGGFTTIQLPAKNAQAILQRIVSGDTARDVASTRASATTGAAATRGAARVVAAELGKEGRLGAAQIGAQSRITVEGLRDNRMLQASVYNFAGKTAQVQYSKTMDGITKWADLEQKTGYLNFGPEPQAAQAAFNLEKQKRTDAANRILIDDTESKIGSALPGGNQGAAAPTGNGKGAASTGTATNFPIKAASPPSAQANRQGYFQRFIETDPQLQTAKGALDKANPSDRSGHINSSKVLSDGQKAILRGFYGLNK